MTMIYFGLPVLNSDRDLVLSSRKNFTGSAFGYLVCSLTFINKKMLEVNKVGVQPPINEQPNDAADNLSDQSVGRGAIGQPVGVPPKTPLTQNALMSEVVTGRDATQTLAAEQLRSSGGGSATDALLGLNRQPSVLGGLLAPPGNLEALRHLSPVMRRQILRNLLIKQKNQMRRLVAVARDEKEQQRDEPDEQPKDAKDARDVSPLTENASNDFDFYNQRVYRDLAATTKMLDLLDELMNMQDYTLSRMGTFAQG